ncbi:uncharacterized protein LOC124156125 [Ischnura elegans]|uniref:uncharacterized protein LOC124156125 n=1 Tax=Ischnura elegans TaxID=197161 RepID=UPI001ED87662|nr:uncharacterized protein LOC124156125 [Ischnura elegans]
MQVFSAQTDPTTLRLHGLPINPQTGVSMKLGVRPVTAVAPRRRTETALRGMLPATTATRLGIWPRCALPSVAGPRTREHRSRSRAPTESTAVPPQPQPMRSSSRPWVQTIKFTEVQAATEDYPHSPENTTWLGWPDEWVAIQNPPPEGSPPCDNPGARPATEPNSSRPQRTVKPPSHLDDFVLT